MCGDKCGVCVEVEGEGIEKDKEYLEIEIADS